MATTTATTATKTQEQAYANMTNEDLVTLITAAHSAADNTASIANAFTLNDALDQLFKNLAPITLNRAEMYRGKMDTYDTEDFLQVGKILIWEIIQKGNFKAGKFANYYNVAITRRLANIYRDYTLKNPICIGEFEDAHGNVTRILAEADYAKTYREKHRAQCRAWSERKKASQPPKEKKPPMTKEERTARQMAYQRKYYAEHPEKYQERLAKERERQRRKREAERRARECEKLAVMSTAFA